MCATFLGVFFTAQRDERALGSRRQLAGFEKLQHAWDIPKPLASDAARTPDARGFDLALRGKEIGVGAGDTRQPP